MSYAATNAAALHRSPTKELIAFFRHAFLRHAPHRYAAMQPQQCFEKTGEKYHDYPGELSDQQIGLILSGKATFAVPYAENGLAHLLALDVDCDHLDDPQQPIHALRDELARRDLWHFAHYDPARRRGYVYVPFSDLTNAARLAALGETLITAISQPGWKIENRATNEDTRLPLCRHTWTGSFGTLLLGDQQIDIDADPRGALAELRQVYRENPVELLPPPPAPTETQRSTSRPASQGISIARFNAEHNLADLLDHYGAKRAGRRLFLCPFHDDQHASLVIWQNRAGVTVCHCKSRHSACPLAERPGCDAFYVYCIGERLTPQQALRRLNGLPDDPDPKPGPQAPPAPPHAAPARGGHHEHPPPTRSTTPHHFALLTQHRPTTTSPPQRPTRQARETPESIETTRTAIILSMAMDSRLKNRDRAILRAILQSTPTLEAYQSVNYYTQQAGYSERTTRYALRDLEQQGYLLRTRDRSHEGQTNVYRISVPQQEGGQNPAPTWNHEITTTFNLDLASRGGQDSAQQTNDQAELLQACTDVGVSVHRAGDQPVGPVLVEQLADAHDQAGAGYVLPPAEVEPIQASMGCTQTRVCVQCADDQPAALVLVEQLADTHDQAGASYEPSLAEMDERSGDRRREWHATLRPSALYALLYAERDMYQRWQVCGQDQAEEQVLQEQLDSFDQADAGDAELGDAPSQLELSPVPARRRVVPIDPAQRAKYYKFLGAAKKAKSEAQARRLRELAAALLVEVDDEDQADELPALVAQRTIARTPQAVRPRGCSTGAPPPPPTSSSAPDMAPELDPAGWRFEWCAGGLRGVHRDGWATRSYQADWQSIRGHIERRNYYRIEG